MKKTIVTLANEPLVQFLALGVLVFAVDRYVLETGEDPRRILVDDARYAELVAIFEEGQARPPTEAEIGNLIVKWTQNEVMYREAQLMGLDRGDEMIRQRLILKLRDILFNNIITEVPPDEDLEAWFEENRSAYDRPPLLDFEQFLVAELDKDAAGELAGSLQAAAPPEAYARTFRQYRQRPPENLTAVFGREHGRRLIDAGDGHWLAVESDYGWHLARVTARRPGQRAEYADVRHQVSIDWLDEARKRELADALGGIVENYDIRYELTRDLVEESLVSQQLATAR